MCRVGDEVTECYKDVGSFSVAKQVLSIKLKTLQCCCVIHGHYAIRRAFLEQRQTGIWLKTPAFYTFTLLIHHDITTKTIFSIKCQPALSAFTLLIHHDITTKTVFSIKCQPALSTFTLLIHHYITKNTIFSIKPRQGN